MKKKKMTTVLLSVFVVASLSGCALFNKATVTQTRTTTIGKELVDLQEAKEKGIVSEEEYTKLKKEILSGGLSINATCVKKCGSE